jgi:hypothetical protein
MLCATIQRLIISTLVCNYVVGAVSDVLPLKMPLVTSCPVVLMYMHVLLVQDAVHATACITCPMRLHQLSWARVIINGDVVISMALRQ